VSTSPLPPGRLLVLLYHNVGTPPRGRGLAAHWIAPAMLRRQIKYLKEAGHTFLRASEALAWLDEPDPAILRPVLVTFDDGLRNLYTQAFPVLQAEQVTPLLFQVAGHIGNLSSWEPNPRYRDNEVLDWSELRDLSRAGWEVGSHTLTHPDLTQLGPEALRHELVESKRLLEAGLDRAVDCLAYPYGYLNRQVEQLAQGTGYRAAFSTRLGLNGRETDRFALPRMNVRRGRWLFLFRRKLRRAAHQSH
jgi:peptidoglycan/xylan/chitin deacetylase (PgdA/CDA1 family)